MRPFSRTLWVVATLSAISTALLLRLDTVSTCGFTDIPVAEEAYFSQPRPRNLRFIREQIPYLETAKVSGIKGEVRLLVFVDPMGNYAGHEVLGSDHPLLRIPCETYARYLRFRPATENDRPVAGTWVFRHTFGDR